MLVAPHKIISRSSREDCIRTQVQGRAPLTASPKSLIGLARGAPRLPSPSPGSPLPTCGYTMTRGDAARAYTAAAPSAGGSGRPGEHRTTSRPAHLQRPPRGLPGTRKRVVARRGRKDERALRHFRFFPGEEPCRAVMSLFKFVGKGGFSLSVGLADCPGPPLRGLAFPGYGRCPEASNAGKDGSGSCLRMVSLVHIHL